jgi:hypothetical protein
MARREWLFNLSLDDQLWHQSMVVLRNLDEERRGQSMTLEEQPLFHLIQLGVVDPPASDHPFESATRSMRYSAAIADRLWNLLREERERVSVRATSPCLKLPDTFLDREIE